MGLTHPRSLEDWRRWQAHRRRLQRVAHRARRVGLPDPPPQVVVTTGGPAPSVLVVLDSLSPSTQRAVLDPVRHLDPAAVALVSPVPVRPLLPPGPWVERTGLPVPALDELVTATTDVVSIGHFLPLGGRAYAAAARVGARHLTVEHGLLTPHAPPLAPGTTVLAWSEADADFWRSGRDDVEVVVLGSQLLWRAAEQVAAAPTGGARPVYLGQLHGAELARGALAGAAEAFCLAEGAAYRPHPAETDRRSRATHARLAGLGIHLDTSGTPLPALGAPVVGVFSTGILEAAAAGLPAHVAFPAPPPWLEEFWDRYAMSPWGAEPTIAPPRPPVEPAAAIARLLRGGLGGRP